MRPLPAKPAATARLGAQLGAGVACSRVLLLGAALVVLACGESPAPVAPDADSQPPPAVRVQLAPDVLAALEDALAAARERPDDPSTWLALAMTYDAHSLSEQAASSYAEAERRAPDDARPVYLRACALADSGDLDGALAALARAETLAPDYAPIHWRRGAWLLEAGRLDEAQAAFARADALQPEGLAGALGLARVELARDDAAAAVQRLQPLAARHPEQGELQHLLGMGLRALGRLDEARLALARWDGRMAPRPDPWADEVARHRAGYHAVMEQALAEGQAGRAEAAIAPLEALHAAEPDDSAVLEKLVVAYREAGRVADARRVLRAALQRDASHYRAWFALAEVEEQRGDLRAALNAVGACLERHESWAPAHELAARLLWKGGDLTHAALALQDALTHGGPSVVNLRKLARARGLLDQWALAEAALAEALALEPGNASLHALLAEAHLEQFELGEVSGLLLQAEALDPDDGDVRRVRADFVALQGLLGPGDIEPDDG